MWQRARALFCLWPWSGAFKYNDFYKADVIDEAPRFVFALVKRPVWPSLGVLAALGPSVLPHARMPRYMLLWDIHPQQASSSHPAAHQDTGLS